MFYWATGISVQTSFPLSVTNLFFVLYPRDKLRHLFCTKAAAGDDVIRKKISITFEIQLMEQQQKFIIKTS